MHVRLFRGPFDSGEITDTVDDPHHLHPVFHQPVKRQPTFDNERPCVFGNLWMGGSELWVVFQQLTGLLNAVIDLVGGGGGIPGRDVEPDVQKVFAGTVCKTNLAHALTL
jgi:hypothetical protein